MLLLHLAGRCEVLLASALRHHDDAVTLLVQLWQTKAMHVSSGKLMMRVRGAPASGPRPSPITLVRIPAGPTFSNKVRFVLCSER